MFNEEDIKNAKRVKVISFETDSKGKLSAIAKLTILFGLILSIFSDGSLPEKIKLTAKAISIAEEKIKPIPRYDAPTIIINDSTLEDVTINQRVNNK